jgi:predicted phage-related endonuclease
VKTISGYSADSYEAGIPPSYLVQLQHYLLVTEWSYGEIVYLKDGRELGCVTFEANRGIQDSILLAAEEFHNRVMAAKKEIEKTNDVNEQIQIASHYEPDADNSQAFNDFVSEKHKAREEEVTIQGTDECGQWALSYTKLNAGIKVLESEKQLFQNRLKQVMEKEGATTMMLPNGKITWRKQFSVKL